MSLIDYRFILSSTGTNCHANVLPSPVSNVPVLAKSKAKEWTISTFAITGCVIYMLRVAGSYENINEVPVWR